MSALAMILMAGMAVGDVPKQDVGEANEQRLCLRGKWEGVLYHWGRRHSGTAFVDENGEFAFIYRDKDARFANPCGLIVDEGKGCFQIDSGDDAVWKQPVPKYLGIYEQRGDCLRMCLSLDGTRPTSFQASDDNLHYLLILHRVKPRK